MEVKINHSVTIAKPAQLGYLKLSDNAFAPEKATPGSAGYDLRSAYNYTVPKHDKCLVKTDLALQFPGCSYGRIVGRSGLAANRFVTAEAGVVDPDFTGNVTVLLYNHSNEDFIVNKGDRIAQIICEVIMRPQLVEIFKVNKTERGESGFGSTDKKN